MNMRPWSPPRESLIHATARLRRLRDERTTRDFRKSEFDFTSRGRKHPWPGTAAGNVSRNAGDGQLRWAANSESTSSCRSFSSSRRNSSYVSSSPSRAGIRAYVETSSCRVTVVVSSRVRMDSLRVTPDHSELLGTSLEIHHFAGRLPTLCER